MLYYQRGNRGFLVIVALVSGFFFLFYLALGASVFSAIESPLEATAVSSLLDHKRAFLRRYPCLDGNAAQLKQLPHRAIDQAKSVPDDSLEDFMSSIVEANNRGVSIFKNGSSVPSWTFGQSFFFASTVVTTIGKKNIAPVTLNNHSSLIKFSTL